MTRENWTSSIGFILASAGSAIGLGNIWKFPYMAGENGGGTFVLVYVLCVIFIGLPVMCSEMLIGRHTRRNIINAMGKIERLSANQNVRFVMSALSAGMAVAFATMHAWLPVVLALVGVYLFAKKGFAILGWICTIVALAILSYYAVIGGWIVEYIRLSLTGTLVPEAIDGAAATAVAQTSQTAFGAYIADPWRVLVGFVIFMAVTGWMLLGGIRAGIERMSKILMPLLFILLLVVIVRSVTLPGAGEGIKFLLKPTMDAFTPQVVLMALGQVFFSLSLGMAITVTYGSYLHKEHNVWRRAPARASSSAPFPRSSTPCGWAPSGRPASSSCSSSPHRASPPRPQARKPPHGGAHRLYPLHGDGSARGLLHRRLEPPAVAGQSHRGLHGRPGQGQLARHARQLREQLDAPLHRPLHGPAGGLGLDAAPRRPRIARAGRGLAHRPGHLGVPAPLGLAHRHPPRLPLRGRLPGPHLEEALKCASSSCC